jgi:hypothetical protein
MQVQATIKWLFRRSRAFSRFHGGHHPIQGMMETFYLTTLRAEDTDFQASCTTTTMIGVLDPL